MDRWIICVANVAHGVSSYRNYSLMIAIESIEWNGMELLQDAC